MEYTLLGRTGLRVSRICLGTMTFGWRVEEQEARSIIKRALELGINLFDTANVYARGRTEEILGAALKDRREEVIIATKVFWSFRQPDAAGLSRSFVFKELNDSLRRLQTDYTDIYFIHRYAPSISIENVLRTLNVAIHEGKVRYIGASTMYAWEFAKSLWVADRLRLEPFQVMQPHYNLLYREEEREMLPLCKDQGIGVVPWGPLARGVLAGKYSDPTRPVTPRDEDLAQWFLRPRDLEIAGRVVEVANQKKASPAQIALAWMLSKDEISAPIVGVTQLEQLENIVAATEIKLSHDEIAYLEALYRPRELIGHYAGIAMPGDLG
jgi:aryl-alcohol dehydrogenase-like predicted oxidoreductase